MVLTGEVEAISKSSNYFNIVVKNKDNEKFNIKIDDISNIVIGQIYEFVLDVKEGDRVSYNVISFSHISSFELEKRDSVYRDFYKAAPISLEEAIKTLNSYLSKIENKILYDITNNLMNNYYNEFLISPAAAKMHHAYIGGLAYHTIGMLKLADSFIANYPYLKRDYMYSGIILHDMAKVKELSGIKEVSYSLEGQLLGHLIMESIDISIEAKRLGYENSKEVLFLKHMIVSHHGIPQYGSAKKPMTAEAMALWFIDTIDSKFRVIGERLDQTNEGEWTDLIGVIDKSKLYKY